MINVYDSTVNCGIININHLCTIYHSAMTCKSVSFFSLKYVKYVPMYIKCLDFDLDD